MMGRGVEGGCGTQQKPLTFISSSSRTEQQQQQQQQSEQVLREIGFFDQARKALTERCPFDSEEVNVNSSCRVSTLPVGLADVLSRSSNNSNYSRKRQKKSSSGHFDSSNIWAQTEDYFRLVGLNDIDNLFNKSSFGSLVADTQSCFTILPVSSSSSNTVAENVGSVVTTASGGVGGSDATGIETVEGGSDSQSLAVVKEEKENGVQLLEIDGLREVIAGNALSSPREEIVEHKLGLVSNLPDIHSNLEWLLGSRNKVFLTSERPSKKRKLLGSDAGLNRLRVLCPSEGHSLPVCHLCCLRDLGDHSNQLLVCESCKVVVHQKCYGVQDSSVAPWLCSWCKYCGETGSEIFSAPCCLCPRTGGALKPVAKDTAERKSSFSGRFAHLVCSQWMPEVFVEDTRKMEPIMNLEGIKETRQKLVCNVCKVKYGACVRCSHGTCRTAFHPLCSREAKHKMEIWGKTESETVELRAFCSKHSDFQHSTTQQANFHPPLPVGCDSSVSKIFPVKLLASESHKLKLVHKNGDKSIVLVPTSDGISTDLGNSEVSTEQDTPTPRSDARPEPECHDVNSSVSVGTSNGISKKKATEGNSNDDSNSSDSLDFTQVLKKLVDRGKAILSDVALEIGISTDFLATTLAGDRPSFPDLNCKILKWLRNHAYMCNSQSGSNSAISLRASLEGCDGRSVNKIEGNNIPDAVLEKSMPPRKPISNITFMKDNKIVCSTKGKNVLLKDNAIGIGEVNTHSVVSNGDAKNDGNGNGSIFVDGDPCVNEIGDKEKISSEPSGFEHLGFLEQSVRPKALSVNQTELQWEIFGLCSAETYKTRERGGIKAGKSDSHPSPGKDGLLVQIISESCSILYSNTDIVELGNGSICESGQATVIDNSIQCGLTISNEEQPVSAVDVVAPVVLDFLGVQSSCSYIHPFIQKRLSQLQTASMAQQENININLNGVNERHSSSVFSNDNNYCSPCIKDHTPSTLKLEQLVEAKKMGILDLSLEDEVEGELVYYQNKLIDHAVRSRRYCDDLMFRVINALPQELDTERKQRWDSVLVNQYISGLREARKQVRKEKRYKEDQAVLAAATAAAAASSRISSFRKDSHDEAVHQEVSVGGRTAPYSQLMPRAKETLSRLAVSRVSSDKPSDIFQLKSFLNEQQQLCDICRRSETMMNPVVFCSNCKVAVHFGCYRGAKDHTGPWYCELCEELLPFRSPRSLPMHLREKSTFSAQCGLCGGTNGAFRKSTDGQWVHAFCAEWLLELTFRRGQPNLVEGMETVLKGRDLCCICCRRIGLCIKCNYGNCQSTFHPSCARNAGYYMYVRTSGGKLLHKAYCDRHSMEQREKAETQQHGPEELKAVKQIRVELERVRLLCERIIKREKVKRELVICSHNILASKRDSVAFSVLVRSPFFMPDVSSESATTSLRGHVDDNKSCSEAIQRSEDITVDSAVSGKRRILHPVPMDIDQKTDDSSTSQQVCIRNQSERPHFSGKQLPQRPASVASRNLADDEERRSMSRKHTETFQKELVMTSDQASVKNQRLPKGFAYVPIVCLPKEKPAISERESSESVEPDG
ncbi:Phd finger family protein [Thalictrum thalictroides]|uniref:Phd finger family protein n=1 Tax=Thalictrum thalictroides TaxID=46969 RepID=A0A7J6X343_THATH|nr:Phd finger family protein [Thalictrum thalictroides]